MMDLLQGLAAGVVFALGILLGSYAGDQMCHQWGGDSAIIHDGKCMVPTDDGGLRPARKDSDDDETE